VTDIRKIPSLMILPVEKLVLHEYHDSQRTPPLAAAIKSSNILRNPPIVIQLKDGSERFLVLDGANRLTALKSLGVPHIVVQVVEADSPGVDLSSWNHVIWGISQDELLDRLMDIPNLILQPTDCERALRTLMDIHSVAVVCCPNRQAYDIRTPRLLLIHHVELWNEIVNCYQNHAYVDRTRIIDIESLKSFYTDLSGLLILPSLRVDQLMSVASNGQYMPPGSTRFTISPRVLQLNFPLDELASDRSLTEKNVILQQLVQERLSEKKVRFYEESTYLFDE
jgi:hypothetical protein